MFSKAAQQALADVLKAYGLDKHANMQMIRRIMHFEDLAQHANPQLQQVGQSLLGNVQRAVPKAVAPQGMAKLVQGLSPPRLS
jgi:hypothetical protein